MSTKLPPRLGAAALVCLALLAAWRCGADKKKSDTPPPATTTHTGAQPSKPVHELPASWDGAADFSGSAYEVIDE